MRVGLIGGIFHERFAGKRWVTPETILADGLESRGVVVYRLAHGAPLPRVSPDLVHVHHLGRGLLVAMGTAGRSPVVLTPHDGHLASGRRVSRQHIGLARLAARRTDAVVTLGKAERRVWRSLGAPDARIAVIPNGIPTDPFGSPLPSDSGRGGVLFVGQLVSIKGVVDLLEAVARLDLPEPVPLRLAYQNRADESALRQAAVRLGLEAQLEWLGHQTPAQLADHYRSAAVVALPSHAEALPSVITEAMLGGSRVVATKVGCIEEQVGNQGWVVVPGDVAGLAQAIREALVRPWLPGEAMCRHEWASSRFAVARMVEAHLDLYKELLEGRAARPRRGAIERSMWRFAAYLRGKVARREPV